MTFLTLCSTLVHARGHLANLGHRPSTARRALPDPDAVLALSPRGAAVGAAVVSAPGSPAKRGAGAVVEVVDFRPQRCQPSPPLTSAS